MDISQKAKELSWDWKNPIIMMLLLLPVAKNNYVVKRLTSLKDEGTTDPLKDSMMHSILTVGTERRNQERR